MVKLALTLCVAVALGAAFALVPLRGRTLLDRWNRASGVGDFLDRGWDEAKTAALSAGGAPATHPPRTARPPGRPAAAGAKKPAERHTDADRAALERILAEHAR